MRGTKTFAAEELARMSDRFSAANSHIWRPSIPPKQLIKPALLHVLYSIHSERKLSAEVGYNFLFR